MDETNNIDNFLGSTELTSTTNAVPNITIEQQQISTSDKSEIAAQAIAPVKEKTLTL